MAIYKRGGTYYYEFQFNGQRIQQSAQTANKDAARKIEAAHRVRLAKGEGGIVERPPAPTLAEFSPRFEAAIETLCAEKQATVGVYKEKLRRLLTGRQLADARLNEIDEAVIDGYKQPAYPSSFQVWQSPCACVCKPGISHAEAFTAARTSGRSWIERRAFDCSGVSATPNSCSAIHWNPHT